MSGEGTLEEPIQLDDDSDDGGEENVEKYVAEVVAPALAVSGSPSQELAALSKAKEDDNKSLPEDHASTHIVSASSSPVVPKRRVFDDEGRELSDYEILRLEKVKRNNERLASLGLATFQEGQESEEDDGMIERLQNKAKTQTKPTVHRAFKQSVKHQIPTRSLLNVNYNSPSNTRKRWGKREKAKLDKLANTYRNDWDKISQFLPGRTPQACSTSHRRFFPHSQLYVPSQEHASASRKDSEPSVPKKAPRWTEKEDELLKKRFLQLSPCFSSRQSERLWRKVAKDIPGRTYLACRWRYSNKKHLNQDSSQDVQMQNDIVSDDDPEENDESDSHWSSCQDEPKAKTVHKPVTSRRSPSWSDEEKMKFHELFQQFGTKWITYTKKMPGRTPKACERFYYTNYRSCLKKPMGSELTSIAQQMPVSKATATRRKSERKKEVIETTSTVANAQDPSCLNERVDKPSDEDFKSCILYQLIGIVDAEGQNSAKGSMALTAARFMQDKAKTPLVDLLISGIASQDTAFSVMDAAIEFCSRLDKVKKASDYWKKASV